MLRRYIPDTYIKKGGKKAPIFFSALWSKNTFWKKMGLLSLMGVYKFPPRFTSSLC